MDKQLKIAAWAMILSYISLIGATWAFVIGTICSVIGYYGFYRIGIKNKLQFLRVMAVLIMLAAIGGLFYDTLYLSKVDAQSEEAMQNIADELGLTLDEIEEPQSEQAGIEIMHAGAPYLAPYIYMFAIYGIIALFFGRSLLPLRKKYGKLLVPWAAWLNFAMGIAWIVLVLLFWLGNLANTPSTFYPLFIIGLFVFMSGIILLIPVAVVEIMILFRAAR